MRCIKEPYLTTAFVIGILYSIAGSAFAQAPYHAGNTIIIVRGGGPGGSGEFQSRALMPYLKKYIPANPTIMMESWTALPEERAPTTCTRPNPTV